ncbi:MAG TPA: adenosylcobinamide-phosphate synthase CbiB [Pseudomonas sp.]|uniref:adenosylcobinamide-phosphate synthase CbiB n=1 Tax=Pseudomonas sp. TaxID=306 RepID=UPI002D03B035|nr:adenosylcobinamide-phosphate synthase CbiB [Pseudomonas sp.]HRL92417.1 adenosylcobinamide-phosphate synthase CbiB [Pseudomonas sp.]
MSLVLAVLAAVTLDVALGEPRRWHPLVGFGALVQRIERALNPAGSGDRAQGVLAWCLAVLPLTLLAGLLAQLPYIGWLISVLVLYLAIGLRSLAEHAEPIADALEAGDLPRAREQVGRIVSRDTRDLDEEDVARAASESMLENGSDAVFAALFWFVVAGAPGVVLYRLSNTLDAMWGYRTPRFLKFGWAAARLDDVLNYLPARLVALTYALCGQTALARRCWRAQAPTWDSPNAGPVMAAGAGALGLALGGAAVYHDELHQRPSLGEGAAPVAADIRRALQLVQSGVAVWLVLLCVVAALYA